MTKLVFTIFATLALCLGAANAERVELKPGEPLHLSLGCVDSRGRAHNPVAVADGDGVVRLPTGQEIRGYPPNAEICGNFPLRGAREFKCKHLRLAEVRDARFCKRASIEGRTCVHVVCD